MKPVKNKTVKEVVGRGVKPKISRGTKFIVKNIGGRDRKIVIGMRVYEYVTGLINGNLDPQNAGNNSITRYIQIMLIALQQTPEENQLPENFNEDMVVNWIDLMEQEDWDEVKEYIDAAMGFCIQDFMSSLEVLAEKMQEGTSQARTQPQETEGTKTLRPTP